MKTMTNWFMIAVTLGIAVMCVFNTLSLKSIKRDTFNTKYSYAYDCVREAEIEYNKYKGMLVDEVQNYINNIAPTSNLRGYAVVEECLEYNIDICFVLAQGEIESHFATKGIGGKLNNVFNVGIFDDYTEEKVASKYKYDCPNESIQPYLQLLSNRYLVNACEYDLMENYVDINNNRYATDTCYEMKLKSKYNNLIETTSIKDYQDLVISYAVKCNR